MVAAAPPIEGSGPSGPGVDSDDIRAVRAFNRFYTNVIGLLREGLLETELSLTEARVLFELGQSDATEAGALRQSLDLDAGYLSRILARFQSEGLVTRERSKVDARRQTLRLTGKGRRAFRTIDRRSASQIARLLEARSQEDKRRLLGAMSTIRGLLDPTHAPRPFLLRGLEPGDLGWVVYRHGVVYAHEFGWDESFEALVAGIVAEFAANDDHGQRAWIAEVDGERAGCIFCTRKDERIARLRLLLVEPRFRGLGIGERLIEECLRFARRTGYESITLWTNDVLVAARKLYQRFGFELVDEEAHHSFGADLVGQNWVLPLSGPGPA